MKKQINFITEIAIFSAIGVVLDFICGLLFSFGFLDGGSISIAMVPIFMMGLRWGLKGGLITGLIVGVVQIIIPGMAHMSGGPIQVLLDYIIAFTVIGLVGIIAKKLPKQTTLKQVVYASIAMLLAGLIRTMSHTISGIAFYGVTFWGSLIYNALYMIPSTIICIIIIDILIYKAPMLIFIEEKKLN